MVLAILVLAWQLAELRKRLARLEQQLASLAELAPRAPAVVLKPSREPAPDASGPVAEARDAGEPVEPVAPVALAPKLSQRFEVLVGKRLPIWIGGVALAFAGFFLVRYSIELGLFGPRARSVMAALFGLLLLTFAETGQRLPRIGASFAQDPRLAQSLAGAGIATLYGTLYMAAELYGLIGLGTAFALVVAVTLLAMVLSERHGPPTAVLGLAGGYLAPYVAGLPDATLALTLVYLAVFTVGLLVLALHRGWPWLVWCASGASLVWTVSLLAVSQPGERTAIGLLILVAAVGAAWVLVQTAPRQTRLSPVLPFAAGIVQLAALAAMAEFTPLAWALYFALSAAAVVLARREPSMMPGVWGSLGIAAIVVSASFADRDLSFARLLPPLSFALLFGGAGQAFAFRPPLGRQWAWLAACAPGLMLAATASTAIAWGADWAWGVASVVAALPAALIVVRSDNLGEPDSADVAVAATMTACVGAIGFLLPHDLYPLGLAALYAGLCWSRGWRGRLRGDIGLVALGLVAAAMLIPASGLVEIAARAIAGERFHYARIAPVGELALALLLPGLVLLAADLRGPRMRATVPAAAIVAGVALGGMIYAVAKQPLAIADAQAFVRVGFLERALITQALAAAGWWALRGAPWRSGRFVLGSVLAALACFRFVWFDLLLLNPVVVRQALAGWPVLNVGTLHVAAMAASLSAWARQSRAWPRGEAIERALTLVALATMALAVLITLRHAVHGAIVDRATISRVENYLYSAGLLLLALAWLGLGIRRSLAVVRLAGLVLLTAVTFKVFLVDAASLEGLLRVLSFLGLGAALIGIGWAYGRIGNVDFRAAVNPAA